MPAIAKDIPGLFAAAQTLKYEALLWDAQRLRPVPAEYVNSMTLTLIDTLTQNIVNDVDHVDILNKGRGSIDNNGVMAITLNTLDTTIYSSTPIIQRSMVIDWSYNSGQTFGRHQFNFRLAALAAP